ncbi:MAG: M14 family zinc carboxypeptidase [bacterium]
MKRFVLSISAVFFGFIVLVIFGNKGTRSQESLPILRPTPKDSSRSDSKLRKKTKAQGTYALFARPQLHGQTTFALRKVSAPFRPAKPNVPKAYRPLSSIESDIKSLQEEYPDIVKIDQIGTTTALGLPIWAVKISDNAVKREDEPRILFTGVHHAREPIGAKICLQLMKRLCERYGKDPKITRWVNAIEIWFVPLVNPDGYKYILDNHLSFPWWRKNLRDNNGDGVFDPMIDGVDLNRNYDYNWKDGGDGKPSSWFYRGKGPFSEKETQAVRDLAIRENFVIGISYHSYGESILFPWGNYKKPPDLDLIVDIASKMASRIRRLSGRGNYSILPLNGRVGQSSIWMYGYLSVLDYIVEVATEYFPAEQDISSIINENMKGAFYLLDRTLDTGIRGHVIDAFTKAPLLAEIKVEEFSSDHTHNRKTDAETGGFYRIVNPGRYTLRIISPGYYTKTLKDVRVLKGQFSNLSIGLYKKAQQPANGLN